MKNGRTRTVEWFFDVISPFAYLQSEQLESLAPDATIHFRPVLFAGLLEKFGNVGPAEIAAKRKVTFERIAWLAHAKAIPVTMPPMHPFNPIPLLRFVIAAGNTRQAVHAAFRFVWQDGNLPTDAEAFNALLARFSLTPESLSEPSVKQALHDNGTHAARLGVFGVPTTTVDGHVFWGEDCADMLHAYLRGDSFFSQPLWTSAATLPYGKQRKKLAP